MSIDVASLKPTENVTLWLRSSRKGHTHLIADIPARSISINPYWHRSRLFVKICSLIDETDYKMVSHNCPNLTPAGSCAHLKCTGVPIPEYLTQAADYRSRS